MKRIVSSRKSMLLLVGIEPEPFVGHQPPGHLPERPAPRDTSPQAAEVNATRSGLSMSETLYRVTPADLEIRGDGRTVAGIAVPFDEPTPIRDSFGGYTEVFRRGAFDAGTSRGGCGIRGAATGYGCRLLSSSTSREAKQAGSFLECPRCFPAKRSRKSFLGPSWWLSGQTEPRRVLSTAGFYSLQDQH
jgi:hypothetical protein